MSRIDDVPGALKAPLLALGSVVLLLCGCSGGGGGGSGSSPGTLSISTTTLPAGQVGVQYSQTLTAAGGTPPLTWIVASGTLPAGLSLASDGTISGTPTTPGAPAAVMFQVADSGSPQQTKSASLELSVSGGALAITTTSLPDGQVNVAYSTTLQASGGEPPYSWSIATGALPTGVSLSSAGVISGTATAAVTSTVTYMVQDSSAPAQSTTTMLPVTFKTASLTVTTTSLPNGLVGSAYSATLTATGGTPPLTWTLTGGSLPNGLNFDAAGTITGTPTATANQSPLKVQVQDSGGLMSPAVNLILNVSPAVISVSVSPRAAGVAVTQGLSLSATTNDFAGVKWSISPSGGSFSPGMSLTGANVTLTAPATAGAYTVTATSASDATKSASLQLGVTGLAGVYTYHNDLARDGVNAQEYALTTSNVTAGSFGKRFACTVDGAIYAQPLWAANLTVKGAKHNVVFVATQHDGLFAFDADASPCSQLWGVNLIDANHGATAGERTVPSGPTGNLVGGGAGDISPEVGVTGTPVIDASRGALYVVSKSVSADGSQFYQRLHAIDLATGSEKTGSPTSITSAITYPGTGDGGSTVAFDAGNESQRPGLALVNGTIYIAWASHEDSSPYYGWVVGYTYSGSAFTRTSVLNVTPNVQYGGIWMSGAAPAADANNNVYVITANGTFNATSATKPNNDYGDSFLKLSGSTLAISQYFTPSDQASDNSNDVDFGAGGAAVLADLPAGSPYTHLIVGGGKDGNLYVLNRDAMGGYGDGNAVQKFSIGPSIFATGALWNNYFYIGTPGNPVSAYHLNTATGLFSTAPTMSGPSNISFPGSTPSISAGGSTNGIVWALDNSRYCTRKAPSCGAAVLHAYDASNLNELWNSSASGGADAAGFAVKFTVPTVANGKVYVGTRGSDAGGTYGSTSGELDVYGLTP